MATVGFVGLGVMGGGIVRRLLAAGHTVHGYNRTRDKALPLEELALVLEDTPRAVAEAADVAMSMVTNVAALRAVAEGEDGILAGLVAGKVWVDLTTAAPAVSRELAGRAREQGADMVDAPVSGSVSTLEEGRLSIMVGGRSETFERVKPLLLDIGPKATHVGDNGQALLLKIAINLSLFVQMVAFCEGLLLAEKDGIDRETAVEVMLGSVIASPMLI
jgi:3-hydroxyisobutyrate dehydrogenase-like beta-hydroxyacid dehydrogenase